MTPTAIGWNNLAWVHIYEGQLEKATRRLAPFAPAHRGVDVEGVLAQVAAARKQVAEGSLALDPPRHTL